MDEDYIEDQNNSDEEEQQDLDDEDYESGDEYAFLDQDIERDIKEVAVEDDNYESLINDIGNDNEGENFLDIYKNKKRVKKSGIIKISKYEYSKLYGTLAISLMESKIDVPIELINENPHIIQTCDVFIISRFWINNRSRYALPMSLLRNLYHKTDETVDISKLKTDDDLSFKDEQDDTYRFDYNFREKPYDTCS